MNIDQLCFLGSGWPAASQCFTRSAVSASDRRGADDTMATALAVLRRWPRWIPHIRIRPIGRVCLNYWFAKHSCDWNG